MVVRVAGSRTGRAVRAVRGGYSTHRPSRDVCARCRALPAPFAKSVLAAKELMASPVIQSKRLEDRFPVNVIVVSPNALLRQALQEKLSTPRWNVLPSSSGASALEVLRKEACDGTLLLLDPAIPDLEPNSFRAIVQNRFPHTQIMMLNSQTGQLIVGSTSPTALSTKLAD